MTQNRPFSILAMITLLALAGAATIPILARSRSGAVREVHVVVRDMAFHVDGMAGLNPTLRVKRGEHVRFVVRNEDAGIAHDLRIDAWDAGTGVLRGRAEAVLDLRAPAAAGEIASSCTPHAAMMRGTIIIE
jgi:plastocyanin